MALQPSLEGHNARVYLKYEDSSKLPPKQVGWTRFVCLSDTHSVVNWKDVPRGDILIHAGDLSSWGTIRQLEKTINWLGSLNGYRSKILIAGNHDLWLDTANPELDGFDEAERAAGLKACKKLMAKAHLGHNGLEYLQFEATKVQVEEREWTFYGSPASPRHSTGAFQYGTTEEANEINARIPSSTEILITHTPPYRTLDKTHSGKHAGCRNLAERLTSNDLKNCRLHVFGHIHEAAGAIIMDREHTELVAVNAAMMHRKMAVVVDLKN